VDDLNEAALALVDDRQLVLPTTQLIEAEAVGRAIRQAAAVVARAQRSQRQGGGAPRCRFTCAGGLHPWPGVQRQGVYQADFRPDFGRPAMHTPALLPLIVALSATLGAAAAQAQGLTSDITAGAGSPADGIATRPGARLPGVRDGSSNTIRVGEAVPNSLLTRANVSGDITQTSIQISTATANQFVSIGGARALTGSTGSITTRGTLRRRRSMPRARSAERSRRRRRNPVSVPPTSR
jgi:hypothetical protein